MDIRIKRLINLWVHFKFEVFEFDFLFPEDEEVQEVRNSLLPDFFSDINKLYWDHILITIARLLDPYEQRKNFNLSIFALPAVLKEHSLDHKPVEAQIQKLRAKHQDIIDYRMKHLAHLDEDHSVGRVEFGTSTHIDEVVTFLEEMLEIINQTLKALNLPQDNGILIYPAHHRGSRELLNILKSEAQRRKSAE